MRQSKKIISMLVTVLMLAAFSVTSIQAATPRTMLAYEVWGDTPSNRVSLIALITVNDSTNEVVGAQGVVSCAWTGTVNEDTIRWTSVNVSTDNKYAYCAVSYTTIWGTSCTELVKFYP